MADQGQQGPGGLRHAGAGGMPPMRKEPDKAGKPVRPDAPDTLVGAPGADIWPEDEADGSAAGAEPGWHPNTLAPEARLRLKIRQELREFLRAVPRAEEEATLAIMRPDGTTRVLTRAELSRAIDRMRPRMRQVMRLAVEERWSRQRVCEYLRHISIKTFERDQVEGLDLLAAL